MQDLRLVGVHEDGQHLLLAGEAGARFRLPLDDALRAAARRDRPRLGQLQIELDGGLRPREVQTLIRSGLSAEEVADRAGWSVDKVRRYEGPVLAEREYVADLARTVRMRGHGRGTEGESLATRVTHRLTGRGVDPAAATWDAARDAEGRWSVVVLFSAGGRERTATWLFDVPARTVTARDDEARWLSEDDADQSGPIPSPHLPTPTSAPTTVYDVESDGGVGGARVRRRAQDPIDLMAAMRESSRSRRPRRRVHQPTLTPVEDEPREDAVPLEPVGHDPAGDQLPPAARGEHPLDSAGPAESEPEPEADTNAAADIGANAEVDVNSGVEVDAGVEGNAQAKPDADAHLEAGAQPEVSGDPDSSDVAEVSGSNALPDDEVQAAAATEGPTVPEASPAGDLTEPAEAIDEASPAGDSPAAEPPEPADDVEDSTPEPPARPRAIRSVPALVDDDSSSAPEADTGGAAETPDAAHLTDSSDTASAPDAKEPAVAQAPSRPRRGGRPSVPRWDDIMFGAKAPIAERTDD